MVPKVLPFLNSEAAGDFERLTALVEEAIFSESVDPEKTAFAIELGLPDTGFCLLLPVIY